MTRPPGEEPEASVQLASGSDVGQVRSANEDSCGTFHRQDGSATASQAAVATVSELFESDSSTPPSTMLESAIHAANTRIFEMAAQDPELEGMGTTIVAFLLDSGLSGTVAHVGDSRAYRYRRGHLEPITTDHSVVAEMQRRGLLSEEEAAAHPRRNEILRAVGVLPQLEVEISAVDVAGGDRFLLCSDGLTGVVQDDEIAAVVQREAPDDAVARLIQLANERGGPDNITVQILSIPADKVEGDPEATAPIELSTVGIEAIENKRRERKRNRRLASVLALLATAIGAYFLWQLLQSGTASPGSAQTKASAPKSPAAEIAPNSPPNSPPSSAPNTDVEARREATTRSREADADPRDRFEVDRAPPRRGVPRDGTQR